MAYPHPVGNKKAAEAALNSIFIIIIFDELTAKTINSILRLIPDENAVNKQLDRTVCSIKNR
jgi:hypothetical protein